MYTWEDAVPDFFFHTIYNDMSKCVVAAAALLLATPALKQFSTKVLCREK
jgi:hypothetical protein